MATTEKNSSWERIQAGVNDAERLITQRDYNSSMIKSRQTLEFMVKQLAFRAHIDESFDLKNTIDELYQQRWISKTTFEHYHSIRMIGNKAVHEGYSNALDASQAYHMLSQEVYTFSNDYSNALKGTKSHRKTAAKSASDSHTRKRSRSQGYDSRAISFVKLLIPLLCIIILICVIRFLMPKSEKAAGTGTTSQTTAAVETTGTEPVTESTEETAASISYKTTSILNVRSQPSTDSEILGKLDAGVPVDLVNDSDADWAVILYKGEKAYVAKQYLTRE